MTRTLLLRSPRRDGPMSKIRLLLIEGSPVICDALQALLAAQAGLEVVGQANSAHDALEAARQLAPDVIVTEIALPDASGVGTVSRLRIESPASRIVVLTQYDDPTQLRAAMAAGASAYLVKRATSAELFGAIWASFHQRVFVDLNALHLPAPGGRGNPRQKTRLSQRELDVLRLLASGHSNRQTADRLKISVKTVETYRQRVCQKLNLHTRAELFRYASEMGLMLNEPGDATS